MAEGGSVQDRMQESLFTIAKMNGYNGPKTGPALSAFFGSSPSLQAKARAIGAKMAQGGMVKRGFAEGGTVMPEPPRTIWVSARSAQGRAAGLDKDDGDYGSIPNPAWAAWAAWNAQQNATTPTATTPTAEQLQTQTATSNATDTTTTTGTTSGTTTTDNTIVLGSDGVQYPNAAAAEAAGITSYTSNPDSWSANSAGVQNTTPQNLDAPKQALATATANLAEASRKLEADPENTNLQDALKAAQAAYANAQGDLTVAQEQYGILNIPTASEAVGTSISSPESLVKEASVSKIETATPDQLVAEGTGEVTSTPSVTAKTVETTELAEKPTEVGAETYDASTASGDIRTALEGGLREYKVVDPAGAGFQPPPPGSLTTMAMETFYNPTTGERVFVNSGGWTAPEGWVRGNPPDLFREEGVSAAQGEASKVVTPETMDPNSLAQLGLSAPQIEEIRTVVDNGDLKVTPEQLSEAATLASAGMELPQAIAQVTGEPQEVVAAKFGSATPEAQAVTDFEEVKTGTVEGTVGEKEIVDAQGVGLNPEQAEVVNKEYRDNLEAAKGSVGDGEIIEGDVTYKLDPTETAKLNETVVQDAAKAEIPTAEAAQSTFESTVEAATGMVGAEELVDAKEIVKVAETIEATAATMEALDEAAKAQAVTGTLSQAALAVAEQGTVPASATISGQMSTLMEQFNDGTPSWAAGAIRAANAAMAARGLGASSMAGAAITQAAMEAALPIAQGDAQMFMQMELTNLDNRQQVALANAAAQQNMELQNLSNEQAAALQNSAQAFALQGQNLSNQQATVIANAQIKASLQGQVLDIYTQTSLSNASRYAEINNINLNNEQQTLLQRSAQNLQVDLTNLDATQQTALANLQVQASLRGQELTNEQQMAMLESTQAFSAAEFNANAKQQAFLQDASARLAMEGKVLDLNMQKSMFNASRVASVNDVNLSNEQQVLLQRSAEGLQIDLANLSTESQTALANAQLRAALQGKVLDNEQQAAVLNAARYAEVNDLNLTNKQQAFMQDANIKASFEGKVLDNKQQAAIFNVANLIEERGLELNNEQQTRLFNMTNRVNVDMANLSNKQATALANAQIEATMRGQELTNIQQTGVLNAARISEIANVNFTADEQRALENAKLAQTVDVQNLSASSAKALADAAALTNVDLANLDNRQKAQVSNAQNFLQLDLANLSNEQQTEIFKAQTITNALLSDQAAENAALQFNAASENQVTQFFADLSANISKFNADQKNAIAQANVGEENAAANLEAQLLAARDQFNASNALIISQANAKWRQDISTLDTAAENEAASDLARTMNGMTLAGLNEIFQKERDMMDYAFTAGETAADRAMNILLADKKADLTKWVEDANEDAAKGYLYTKLTYDLVFGGGGGGGGGGGLLGDLGII